MGVNNPTVEPSNVDVETKRKRMKRDLQSLECVADVRDDMALRSGVVFEMAGPCGDITSDVLRVLANHGAFLPEKQPASTTAHNAVLHSE